MSADLPAHPDAGSLASDAGHPDAAFLAGYDPAAYPAMALSVDLVVLAMHAGVPHVAVIERGAPPFAGLRALPGGFVTPHEDALAAAHRELGEETGLALTAHRVHVEQLATFSDPARDPRMRVASVAHLVLLAAPEAGLPALTAGTDASGAAWLPLAEVQAAPLAFDHAQILAAGVERLAGKMEYTTIAAALLPPEFTMSALRAVYTGLWQIDLPAGNFTRKMQRALHPTERKVRTDGAPASLFTAGGSWISPPFSRPARDIGRA